jgi:uncharacterized protein
MHEPVFLDALRDSKHFDLIIYGHTHVLRVETARPVIINPGELCGYITGKASAVIFDLAKFSAETLSF